LLPSFLMFFPVTNLTFYQICEYLIKSEVSLFILCGIDTKAGSRGNVITVTAI